MGTATRWGLMGPRTSTEPVFVVAIGASAAGLDALERFFSHAPLRTGMTFVVIQHRSPDHASQLDSILARHTTMAVHLAEHGAVLEPNAVYLNPPRTLMSIHEGRIQLDDKEPGSTVTHPIDHFFHAMAVELRGRCAAIVMSGTGDDGSRGIAEVHHRAGLVIAQESATAGYAEMPQAAIDSGHVDLVLAPEDMPEALQAFHEDGSVTPRSDAGPPAGLAPLVELLSETYGVDFSEYKLATIARRTDRRLTACGAADLDAYLARLASDPTELDALYRDLLIGVTQFFRDREAFEQLGRLLPELLLALGPEDEFRAWVAGCATGEEAYSIAILVREGLDALGLSNPVKIFATDVHREALRTAGAGTYDDASVATLSPERRLRWFARTAGKWRIAPAIRSMVVFAPHNVLQDVPFNRLDLISCRNLLIYFKPVAQRHVLEVFHFGLKPRGILFLGSSESLLELTNEFEVVDGHLKFLRKVSAGSRPVRRLRAARNTAPGRRLVDAPTPPAPRAVEPNLFGTYDALLDVFIPPSILIDARGKLVQTFAGAGKFLRVPEGRASWNALDLLGDDLRIALSAALEHVFTKHAPVRYHDLRIERNGESTLVDMTVREIISRRTGEPHALVLFDSERAVPSEPVVQQVVPSDQMSRDQIAALERALRTTKETLQTTTEALETANEELQATNEELVASNEELKTTNEELHTVNQELTNLNSEFQRKIDELTQLTSDMDLLIASTEVHTLFLDRQLRIRRFTPLIAAVFHLVPSDIGRPIDGFNHALRDPAIYGEAQQVLATGAAFEQPVRDANDVWYLLRILPYRRDGVIDGVVLTLVDISNLRRAEAEARDAASRRDHFLAMLSHELRNPLSAILNAARILERGPLPVTDAATWHRLLLERAQHMTHLVDDLLDVARLTQNKLVLRRAHIDLCGTTREVLDEVTPEFRERGIKLRTRSEDSLVVFGDATRLHQLQVNLLTNAARHAPAGSEVGYTIQRVGDWAEIRVTDAGSGIAPDMLDKIFELFVQGDGPGSRGGDGGLGVGLALVRRIAELHGGTAVASSPGVGRGAEFRIRLPLVAPSAAAAFTGRASPPGRPRTVLLVDDDLSSRAAMAKLLELDGITVTTAKNGPDALEILGRGRPELVLLDLGLPGMDGFEVCRRMRALADREGLLILALTGFGQDSDRDATRRAGFDGHLTKPVDVHDVYTLYARGQSGRPDVH